MPGNEVGDRVHNFFEQEHVSQGQYHPQIADGNWAAANNNFRVGNQRQFDALSSKTIDYSLQQSDLERARNNQFQQVRHNYNPPSSSRADSVNNQSHNLHQDFNGYMYGHQASQIRPEDANYVGMGIESNLNNSGRGVPLNRQLQGSSTEHPAIMRMDSFESPVSYDFFGGQPKVSEHPSMRQSLPEQQSESSDMQQLQQQLMFRKIKELQRQKDFQQLHARQQHSVKQVSSFTGQGSGNRSYDFINGTPVSDASPWAKLPTGNTNWLHNASSAMQGSPGGLVFTPGQGQASQSGNLIRQQVDQSLPGVPISRLRDSSDQYQYANNKSLQQQATYNNSYQGNNYAAFPEQVNMQDEHINNSLGFQGHKLFGQTSHQGPSGRMNMENPDEVNSLEKNVAMQDFQRKQMVGPSGTSHDTVGEARSSQNSVGLDPAEEKILFGSDDISIWDAFGEKTVMNGEASNCLDSSEINGLPSIQSGSWSALMQSAVAEISSSDVGIQENWTNLSIQHPNPPTRSHQSSTYDTGKHHTSMVANSVQVSAAAFEPVPLSEDTNLKNNYHNSSQVFQQPGQKTSREQIEGQGPNQQSSAGESNWLNSGNQNYGSASHSVNADSDGRRYSNHWAALQNGPSQLSKPNSWTFTNDVTHSGDMPSDVHGKGNHVQNSQNGQKQLMHESLNLKGGIWKVNPMSNSSAEMERLRSTTGSFQEGSSLNTAAVLNSTKSRAGDETNFLGRWKPMEAFVKTKESEDSRKPEHLLKNGPLFMGSAFPSSEKEVKTQNMDTFTEKENQNAGYRSNVSNNNFTDGSKETELSDASDSQSLAGGKQKSSNPGRPKSAGPRKFQYHPMGNLGEDVEPSYQTRHASHSKMMHLHNSEGFRSQDKGFFGNSKLIAQLPRGFIEKGKGQLPDHQEDTNRLDEVSFRGSLPNYGPEMSSAISNSVGMSALDKASHSSENMLELLHKVDQLKEHSAMHSTSTGYIPRSQTPEAESSDGIGGCLQQNQSSSAQGFGLQLAPPAQIRPGLKHFTSNPSRTDNYSSNQATGVGGDQGRMMLNSTALGQSLPSHEVGRGEYKNTKTVPGQTAIESWHTMQESFSSDSSFPCTSSQLQDQLMAKASGHAFSKECISQTITTTGISQKGAFSNRLSNIWPNVPPPQQLSGAQDRPTQPNPVQHHQSDIVESTLPVLHNLEEQGPALVNDSPSELGVDSSHPQGLVCEKEVSRKNVCVQVSSGNTDSTHKVKKSFREECGIQQLHHAPSMNPPSTRRDIEAFGRTLKPNNLVQQDFSLTNQIRAMKDVETDPSYRGSKRQKGTRNILLGEQVALRSGQPYEADATVEDGPLSSTCIPCEDPKVHHFSKQEDYGARNESENLRHGTSAAFNRIEHPNISPQMDPSWSNQYGSIKDGQMLPIHDAHKAVTLKVMEQSNKLSYAESLDHMNVSGDAREINDKHPIENSAFLATENLPSLHLLPPNNAWEHTAVSRPKKRKFAAPEIQSWEKEVSYSCQDLPSLRVAEANWAKAANRLSEKVEEDVDTNNDGLLLPRARKRLSLTRQLMQLLFPAPPAKILSAEASSNYETVVYSVARRALGDTCSLMSCLESNDSPSVQANLCSRKTSDNREKHTSQVMQNFTGRVRKLETELLRLDKKASVSDLKMEVQDVEKISIINRFAMYHSRLQADGADTSSLQNSQKPFPQRYVTAVPLPRNLPDSAQCLSL
ncbi:hypothetical protein DCAR_0311456 [Daucus carota subsp. sativus]|uniref:Uncharacterized protein n=1 Tax=Daucus carota subsp. sativus TaxID=79200 RepID=A0AAF0WMS4_DAUCS|nr:PREDICTED: uncharacterized protein LOC108214231 isoform X1 [Daucus carota subsp. sativus]WOG92196.1 hypothetical protein DCAR_0311456 [Daucus carota subsp. sativus]